MAETSHGGRVLDSGRDDFLARVKGEITSEEYVRRLEERVRERAERNKREGRPIASAKDFAARYFRICRHCRGTGVDRG